MNAQRQRLAAAEQAALAAQRGLLSSWQPWRETLRAHRTAALLGGGFAAGLALTLLPLRWWSHTGAWVFRFAARAARQSLPFGISARNKAPSSGK